jgi:hypothetical protein
VPLRGRLQADGVAAAVGDEQVERGVLADLEGDLQRLVDRRLVEDAAAMKVAGTPSRPSRRHPPNPLALSAIPAELAPWRPTRPASTVVITVGADGCTMRRTTTVG